MKTLYIEEESKNKENDTEKLGKIKLKTFFAFEEENDESRLTNEMLLSEKPFEKNIRYKAGESFIVSPLINPDAPRLTKILIL